MFGLLQGGANSAYQNLAGMLPTKGSRRHNELVQSMVGQGLQHAQQANSPLASLLAPIAGAFVSGSSQKAFDEAQEQRDNEALAALMGGTVHVGGGGSYSSSPAAGAPTNLRDGIVQTAQHLGMDPNDLGTIISYETGGTFDPRQAGPTTQWGQHRGLIQFGEPQALKYGADFSSEEAALASQFGPNGAIANYFRDNGWQSGMDIMQAYSIVNAGGPNRFDRTDANNGGAPGTVADKVNNQFSGHRRNAARMLGGEFAAAPTSNGTMNPGRMAALVQLMSNEDISPAIRGIAQTMVAQSLQQPQGLNPLQQIQLQNAQLDLQDRLNPTVDPMAAIEIERAQLALDADRKAANAEPKFDIRELADGRQYYVDPAGQQPPRLVHPDLNVAPNAPTPLEQIKLEQAQLDLEQSRLNLAEAQNPTVDPNKQFDSTTSLRKEFNGLQAVKGFAEQSTAFGRIQASAKDPSPAGDLAMIFNYMKVLDPGSVVRESEFATAAQASSWLQQSEEAGMNIPRPIASAIRQVATGQRLAPEQRQDFVDRAAALYMDAERQHESIRSQYLQIAERNNLPVADAIVDYRYKPGEVAPATDGDGAPADTAAELIDAQTLRQMQPDQIRSLGSAARIDASELVGIGLSPEQWDALEALYGDS